MTDNAPPTHEAVLASIVEARGGRSCFTTETLAIASALAHLLVGLGDGDVAGAQSVTALLALLPPRVEHPGKPWNLELLSDRQLTILERLQAIATGEAPPMIEHRPRSRRYWIAQDLVRVLDTGVTGQIGRAEASAETLIEIRNLVQDLLSPLYLPTLFEET